MTLKTCMLINNDCYKTAKKITDKPVGIVVHSTGCNNKTLKRYVNPVLGQENYSTIIKDIGKNLYNNHWNRSAKDMGRSVCVHAFIGTNENGKVETYQTLPFDYCCWGVGTGINGSYNYNPTAHIQFEICEDNLTDASYFNSVMKEAQEFCAYLCKLFNLDVSTICSHYEAHKLGYGSNHGDCDYWLKKNNLSMDWFRTEVSSLLNEQSALNTLYRVQVGEYKVKQNAVQMADKLNKLGFSAKIVKETKGV